MIKRISETPPPPDAVPPEESKSEKGAEQYAELWKSLTFEEQKLAESLIDKRSLDRDSEYLQKDLDPERIKGLVEIDLDRAYLDVSNFVSRGIGSDARDEEGKIHVVTRDNWRDYGPRAKWNKEWASHFLSLRSKIEAFRGE